MRRIAAAAVAAGILTAPGVAAASTVQIGELAPPNAWQDSTNAGCGYAAALYIAGRPGRNADRVPIPGAAWTVPAGGGTITSWSVNNAPPGTPLRLAVTRFTSWQGPIVDARSALERVTVDRGLNTFATRIPVRGGEQISLEVPYLRDDPRAPSPLVCYYAGGQDDAVWISSDEQPDGAIQPMGTGEGYTPNARVNITATLDTGTGGGQPPAPPPASPPPAGPSPVSVTRLRMRRVIRRGSRVSIAYVLSAPATAIASVERLGRRHRLMPGALTQDGVAGLNRMRFDVRVGGRALRPGRYRLRLVARDAAGNESTPVQQVFRVLPRATG